MNRFAKIMQVLGWGGFALLSLVWAQGFLVRDDTPELARHSMIALAAACLCILPRFWTIAYLALAARGRKARGAGAVERAARLRYLALVASILAVAGLAGSFGLAGAILVKRSSPLPHAVAGFVGIALQIAALLLERRALLADAAAMAEMAGIAAVGAASSPSESLRGGGS